MMMSQSLYRTLRARYPQAIIDVMAPAWCRPLLSRMPEVNEAIPMPLGHGALEIGERRKLGTACANVATIALTCCPTRLNRPSCLLCGNTASHRLARRNALRPAERRP
jgi:ADP-heptose:LPS heptosyltransferase